MNCESAQRLLYEAVDRALSPEEQRQADAHLAVCERCRTEAAVLAAMIETVETTPVARPSEAFLSNVMERLPDPARPIPAPARPIPAPARSSWFAPALVLPRLAFAATLAAAALIWLYRDMIVETVGSVLPLQPVIGPVTASLRGIQAYLHAQTGAVLSRLPEPVSTSVEWGSMVLVVTTLAVGYVLVRAAENLDVGHSRLGIGRRS